jgi:hypothetical protein
MVKWKKPALFSAELCRHKDEVGINRKVIKAPAVGEKRLARVSSFLILPDRILNILTVERIFQLGRENRNPVQEQNQVKALLGLLAVTKLADSREKIRRVQALEVLV